MDAAFHDLVRAALTRDEEEELVQSSESVGAPVFAREIGVRAAAALEAIRRLKQTSMPEDWTEVNACKEKMRLRMELEMLRHIPRMNRIKNEAQQLLQNTEAHLSKFPNTQPPHEQI